MLTQERERQTIVVLHGNQTGEELLHEALRVLNPVVLDTDLSFRHFDLSFDSCRATKNHVVEEAADAMAATGFGLKAAIISPETIGDVGSMRIRPSTLPSPSPLLHKGEMVGVKGCLLSLSCELC